MMMQRLTLGAAALAVTLAMTPGGVRASDDDPVVATVNGTKVHKSMLIDAQQLLPQQYQQVAMGPYGAPMAYGMMGQMGQPMPGHMVPMGWPAGRSRGLPGPCSKEEKKAKIKAWMEKLQAGFESMQEEFEVIVPSLENGLIK